MLRKVANPALNGNTKMNNEYTLFKFKRIDKNLIDSLVNSYLYFTPVKKLNDPFDCRIDLSTSIEKAIKACTDENTLRKLNEFSVSEDFQKAVDISKTVGIFSTHTHHGEVLTSNESHLMWTHYADNHRGCCLTYRFKEQWFHDNSEQIIAIDEVSYLENPFKDWFLSDKAGGFSNPEENEKLEIGERTVMKLMTSKSPSWAYEKEVRIIKRDPGPHPIERSDLLQICFGLDTHEKDIALIRKICTDGGYEVTFARVVQGDFEFGLELQEMT